MYARPFINCVHFIYARKNYAGVEFHLSLTEVSKAMNKRTHQLPKLLRVVASVLAVMCKRMEQLSKMMDLQCIVGRIQLIRLWRPWVLRVRGPNNVQEDLYKRIQHFPVTLRRSRNKRNVASCWPTRLRIFSRGLKVCATFKTSASFLWYSEKVTND